jgi:AcrR family transcriptional regulator
MAIKERKEREREGMRELILKSAEEIISAEGIECLSVRKIASKIEYSPSIIYHYFKDKDEIVNHQMQRGYNKILDSLKSVQLSSHNPVERLRELILSYIRTALEMPDEYKAVQLSSSTTILEYTSSMFKGACVKKPAMAILHQCLRDIYKDIDNNLIELTAQIITASTLGFIIKLITEKNIDEKQRQELIDHYTRCIVDSMILGRPIYSF